MFREDMRNNEIKTSHELSGKINTGRFEKICRITNEYSVESKATVRCAV